MKTLSCPIPDNINPLQSNGFLFTINKLPSISFFCQEVTLPSIDLPTATQNTPLVDVPHPGDKMTFGELSVTFLIDENMNNYKALSDWLMGLGFPRSHLMFTEWLNNHRTFPTDGDTMASTSDGVLQVLNSSNNPARTITFTDLFPTNLNTLQLQSNTSDTTYLAGSASFAYTLYEIT